MFTTSYNSLSKRVTNEGINKDDFEFAINTLLFQAAEQLGRSEDIYENDEGEALICEGGEVDNELNALHAELVRQWVDERISDEG